MAVEAVPTSGGNLLGRASTSVHKPRAKLPMDSIVVNRRLRLFARQLCSPRLLRTPSCNECKLVPKKENLKRTRVYDYALGQ